MTTLSLSLFPAICYPASFNSQNVQCNHKEKLEMKKTNKRKCCNKIFVYKKKMFPGKPLRSMFTPKSRYHSIKEINGNHCRTLLRLRETGKDTMENMVALLENKVST